MASGPSISAATFDVSSRYRETEKRLNDGIEQRKVSGDAKGQVQLVVRRGFSRKRVPRLEGEDPIYIFIPRQRPIG